MHPTSSAHPENAQLHAFVVGKLEPHEIDKIETHLAACPTCSETLQQIQDDTFTGLVRDANPPSAPKDKPAVAHADTVSIADAQAQKQIPHPNDDTLDPNLAEHPRYQILELLGRGGMGAVYKAEHKLMERTVALKVINPQLIANPTAVERFQREVRAAARLHHPNIVTAHDAEQAGDVHFLVMEYVPGTDLHDVLQERGPLPIAEACAYIRQAALGLQHAHEQGMVHRDIKPQNLMLTPDGQIKILDFGLASLTTETIAPDTAEAPTQFTTTQSTLTQAGTIMGTPDYMAPEQAQDASAADIRADIYSLGCTLYTLLTGQVPFPEGSALDKIMSQVQRDPTPISEARQGVPVELCRVLEKMMAKDKDDRYQTPAEVAEALEPFTKTDFPQQVSTARKIAAMANALVVVASIALITAIGVLLWWWAAPGALLVDHPADMLFHAFSLGNLVYGGFLLGAGLLMRRVRCRMWVLACGSLIGIAVPSLFALNIASERLSLWQIVIPQWLGLPVCIWTVISLFQRDVREAFAQVAAQSGFRPHDLLSTFGIPAAAVLLGGIVWITTDNGRLQIDCKVDDVKVVVSKGGQEVEVIDLKSGTTVKRLPSGDYKIALKGNRTEVKLSKGGFSITRWKKEIVRVSLVSPGPATPKPTDQQRLVGTWKAVRAEVHGQPVPQQIIDAFQPTMTFTAEKVTWKANPNAPLAKLLKSMGDKSPLPKDMTSLLANGLEGIYHIDSKKSPKTIDIIYLGTNRKTMLGIYNLDGDTLKLCMSLDPKSADKRPKEFTTKPGVMRGMVILKRLPESVRPRDELAFEGEWSPILVKQNGQPISAQALKKIQFPTKFIFHKNRWGAISPDGRRYESSLTLDATKSPKWIDVRGSLFEGMPNYHGIYKIEGDIATMCLVQRNQSRPTAFTTKGKPGAMLIVSRRRDGAAKPLPPRPGDKLEVKYRQAVNKGLRYLVKTQHADGHWEGKDGQFPVAMTALAGMALLMEGSTVHDGPYAESIRKAVAWLTAQSQPDGRLVYKKVKKNTRYMFGHGYAMLFLATVYGQEEDLERRRALKKILTKAVQFTAAARTTRGGWGYKSAKEGNNFDECATSIVQLQGLRAARNAGIQIPRGLIDAEYLRKFTGADGGVLYSLNQKNQPGRPALTAAALAGCEYDSELFRKWWKFGQKKIPLTLARRRGHDEYTHYYYAQAMYILGDTGYARLFPKSNPAARLTWSKYRKAFFDDLVARQLADGTWPEQGFKVGPVYSTAIWTTIMQLDNGVVPIYQRSPGYKKTPSQKD